MKKKILQIMLLFLSIVAGLFIYPVLQKLYEKNWDLIRCMLSVSLLIIGGAGIHYKVQRYCSCEYKFYKLIGMEEHQVIKQFYYKNDTLYIVLMFVFYIISFQNSIVQASFKTIQFLIILLTITSFIYFIRYSKKTVIALAIVLYSLLCGLSLYAIATTLDYCQQGMGILDILWYFRNMAPVAMVYDLLCNKYDWFFLLFISVYYVFVRSEKRLEGKIIETGFRGKNKNSFGSYISNKIYNERNNKIRPYIKEVVLTGRKIQNLLAYVFVYVIYAISLIFVKNSLTAVIVISFIVIVIINIGEDCIYLSDLNTKRFYKLLGQTYECFLSKKIGATFIMNGYICLVYILKLVVMKHVGIILLLMVIQLMEIIYWNLFYSFIYLHMKRYNNILENIRLIFAFTGAVLPGVNIILCLLYYLKGKDKWNYYVGNKQSCKKI